METVIEFLGFSLGAGVAIRAVDSLGGGLRPVLRGVVRLGLVAGETVGGLAATAGRTVKQTSADVDAQVAGNEPADSDKSAAQHIVIARE